MVHEEYEREHCMPPNWMYKVISPVFPIHRLIIG